MSSTFKRTLKIVTIVHVAVLLVIMLSGSFRFVFKKKAEVMLPVTFTVAAPADVAPVEAIIPPDVMRDRAKPKPKLLLTSLISIPHHFSTLREDQARR